VLEYVDISVDELQACLIRLSKQHPV
jgi:hypothetical protein